MNPTNF